MNSPEIIGQSFQIYISLYAVRCLHAGVSCYLKCYVVFGFCMGVSSYSGTVTSWCFFNPLSYFGLSCSFLASVLQDLCSPCNSVWLEMVIHFNILIARSYIRLGYITEQLVPTEDTCTVTKWLPRDGEALRQQPFYCRSAAVGSGAAFLVYCNFQDRIV